MVRSVSLIFIGLLAVNGAGSAFDRVSYRVSEGTSPAWNKKVKEKRHVLLVSLDGVSYPMLQYYLANFPSRLPVLSSLVRRGSFRSMESVFPSMTWSAHASIMTGQYPRRHRVIGNQWMAEDTIYKPYNVKKLRHSVESITPTLFKLVNKSGRTTAALNWPLTQSSPFIKYNYPETMRSNKMPYKLLSSALRGLLESGYRENFRWFRKWNLKTFRKKGHLEHAFSMASNRELTEIDLVVTEMSRMVIKKGRKVPGLMAVHLLISDSWQHRFGTDPLISRLALEQIDRMLGDLVGAYKARKVWKKTAIFITSDHGLLNISHYVDLNRILRKENLQSKPFKGTAPGNGQVYSVNNGQAALVYAPGIANSDLKKVHRAIKKKVYRQCISRVISKKSFWKVGLPLISHGSTSLPDLVVVARPRCSFTEMRGKLWMGPVSEDKNWTKGSHGYWPDHPELASFLIAAGHGIEHISSKKLKPGRLVDIAPTIIRYLGLNWPRYFPRKKNTRFILDGRALSNI